MSKYNSIYSHRLSHKLPEIKMNSKDKIKKRRSTIEMDNSPEPLNIEVNTNQNELSNEILFSKRRETK